MDRNRYLQISVSGPQLVQRATIRRRPAGTAAPVPANTNQPPRQPNAADATLGLNTDDSAKRRAAKRHASWPARHTNSRVGRNCHAADHPGAGLSHHHRHRPGRGRRVVGRLRRRTGQFFHARVQRGPVSNSVVEDVHLGLAQVEFLKGPSSIMSGLNAIGGAVNQLRQQTARPAEAGPESTGHGTARRATIGTALCVCEPHAVPRGSSPTQPPRRGACSCGHLRPTQRQTHPAAS